MSACTQRLQFVESSNIYITRFLVIFKKNLVFTQDNVKLRSI